MSTLHSLLDAHAAQQPNAAAYTFLAQDQPTTRTWAQMQERAAQVAGQLDQAGVSPGERALVVFPEGLDYLDAFFGCLYAGVIAVPALAPDPLQLTRTLPRLRALHDDCSPAVVLTTRALAQPLTEALGTRCLTEAPLDGEVVWPAPGGPGLAYLQYTSGSTASPKGVCVHHHHLLHQLEDFDTGYGHTPDAVLVSWLPATHDLGLVYGRLMGLFKGLHTVFFSPTDFLQRPRRWLEVLSTYRGTHSPSPNVGFAIAAAKVHDIEGLDLHAVRVLLNGAEPIRQDTEQAFFDRFAPAGLHPHAITHALGMSETTAKIVTEPIDRTARFLWVDPDALAANQVQPGPPQPPSIPIASNGRTVLDTEVRIVDPDTCVDRKEDHVGEVWVSGTTVAAGYWNQPQQTAQTFAAQLANGDGPFLRTGDLGFLHEGELYVVGRLKDVLIIRGQNHHAPDLEWAIEQAHEAIRPNGSAAFSVPGPQGEGVVAVAEIRPGSNPKQVFRAMRAALSDLGLAAEHLALVAPRTLYKTASGKLRRRALRQAFLEDTLPLLHRWDRREATPIPPSATPREALFHLTAALLGLRIGEVEPHVPFRELGLDSVTGVTLIQQLGERLGRALRPSLLYDHPTLEALATALEVGDHPEVAAMSEAEVEAALLAELEDL